jgi:Protein of unknown function DUF262
VARESDPSETSGPGRWLEADEVPFQDDQPGAQLVDDAELERLYDTGTARIVTQRNDFLLPNLLDSMERAVYMNLNPPYQRRLRWDRTRKSKLIESLLMNVPIPPIFLYEVDLAKYEVMDGQQRLSTIREYFNNEFPLTGLEEWRTLNRRRYSQLPARIQSGLQRRSIAAIIVLSESSGDIKRFVFERLNTGGVRLNAQEVRMRSMAAPSMICSTSFHVHLSSRSSGRSPPPKKMKQGESAPDSRPTCFIGKWLTAK